MVSDMIWGKLPGLYPIDDENRARYEAETKKGG